ncbi:MAG: hypothetical protein Kow006_06380 [Gammaproteobacteria bacterium]
MSEKKTFDIRCGRRGFLTLTGAGMVAAVAGSMFPGRTFAGPEEAAKWISKITGGAAAKQGNITIELPQIAENGNTVPVTVKVDHPMTEKSYIESIYLIAERNPAPEVADFHLSPANGAAEVSIRMRLAETQKVVAVAKTNDGKFFIADKEIKVTIGGCGG